MQKIALFCLFVIAIVVPASAQEFSATDEKYAKLVQALLDLDAKVERQGELYEKDLADRRHQEAQLREECAALKAKIEQMELEHAEQRLSDALTRKMGLCDDAIADIERKLASTRTVSAGRLGLLKKQVQAVTGAERARLIARRDDLQKQRTKAMAEFMRHVFAKAQAAMTSTCTEYPSVSAHGFGSITQ